MDKNAVCRTYETAKEFFMRVGIRSVTMDDLARELGVSKKTLYLRYASKDILVEEVISEHIKHERSIRDGIFDGKHSPMHEMYLMTQHSLKHLRKLSPSAIFDLRKYYPHLWKRLESFHFDDIRLCVEKNLIRGVEEGIYRKEIDVDIIARLFAINTWFIVDENYFPLSDYHRDVLFTNFVFYHMHGIVTKGTHNKLHKFKELINS